MEILWTCTDFNTMEETVSEFVGGKKQVGEIDLWKHNNNNKKQLKIYPSEI